MVLDFFPGLAFLLDGAFLVLHFLVIGAGQVVHRHRQQHGVAVGDRPG